MIFYFIFVVAFSVILESVVIAYPLTFFVIGLASCVVHEEIVFWAFVAGIILDLFSLRPVGVSSLYFLFLIYLGSRYRKKIYGGTFVYRFLYLFLPYGIYSFLIYKNIQFTSILVTAVLLVFTLFLLERFFPNIGNKKRLEI